MAELHSNNKSSRYDTSLNACSSLGLDFARLGEICGRGLEIGQN